MYLWLRWGAYSLVRTNRAGMGPLFIAQTHPDLECFPAWKSGHLHPAGDEKSGIVDSSVLTIA